MPTASTITLPSAEGNQQAYFARPDKGVPGVVVVQEWFGLVPHIEDIARRFARQGYLAIAPDLYHGKKAKDTSEAERLMQGLDWGKAAAEIAAAVGYLRKEGAARVGIVGFCMGGALTIVGASLSNIDAYAAFYGFPPPGGTKLSNVKAPGIIFFGENETFFSVDDAKKFAAAQTANGLPTEVIVYPGAGHAFFRDTDPQVYKPNAANDAWRRTLELFGERLRT